VKIVYRIVDADGAAGRLLDWLQAPLALFADEYHVPVLSPHAAAFVGTAGELLFPLLLFAGFASRLGALGFFAVNALAVISYRHVLFEEGFEAALAQHVLWGSIVLYLVVHGPGALSLDALLRRRPRTIAPQPVPAT
jgi:putative oxidoreductase